MEDIILMLANFHFYTYWGALHSLCYNVRNILNFDLRFCTLSICHALEYPKINRLFKIVPTVQSYYLKQNMFIELGEHSFSPHIIRRFLIYDLILGCDCEFLPIFNAKITLNKLTLIAKEVSKHGIANIFLYYANEKRHFFTS